MPEGIGLKVDMESNRLLEGTFKAGYLEGRGRILKSSN